VRRGTAHFFIRGQTCLTRVAMASSSRSTVRRAGRCLMQPSPSLSMVHVCVWRTAVSRARAHILVAKPLARSVLRQCLLRLCELLIGQVRPALSALTSPALPSARKARRQREVVCA
jgi:hypothetical protein